VMTIRRLLQISLIALSLFASGCDSYIGVRSLSTTEYAVIFRKLPRFFGGGLSEQVKQPGQTFFVYPWDGVYVLDTRVQTIDWGQQSSDSLKNWVQTRALDGNEVSLAVRIQYQLSTEPQKLLSLIQTVGTSNTEIEKLVVETARADIRQYMNKLRTEDFISDKAKFQGQQDVESHLGERLKPFGILLRSVNLKEHRFARLGLDGSVDESYQDLINKVQIIQEETLRERSRKDTLVEKMKVEFNKAQGEVNEMLEAAKGHANQARARGDGFFKSASNKAKSIELTGKADVAGMKEKIAALDGPGGEALLRLELSKALQANNPRFVLMENGGAADGQLEVSRTDTNALLDQLGVLEAYQENKQIKPEVTTNRDQPGTKNSGDLEARPSTQRDKERTDNR
jgi:hypothetical protein